MKMTPRQRSYLIVTPAHNEERDLERTIQSVIRQTVLPVRYIIVSDGSTDRTDEIAGRYAEQYHWIVFLRREKTEEERNRVEKVAPGKARAIELALEYAADLEFKYFANLDADISFEPDYYERVLAEFAKDDRLGLAGGCPWSVLPDGTSAPGFLNPGAVAGAVQMFRWECYQGIGGYKPYGQEDCIADADVSRTGWKIRNFMEIQVWHHVPYDGYAPTIRSKVPTLFHLGMMDYISWTPAWFILIKAVRRLFAPPYVLAGVSMILGYAWALLSRKPKIPRQAGYWARHIEFFKLVSSKLKRSFRLYRS